MVNKYHLYYYYLYMINFKNTFYKKKVKFKSLNISFLTSIWRGWRIQVVSQIQSRHQYRTYYRSRTTRKIDLTVFAFGVTLMCYHSTSTSVSVIKCNAIGVEETSDRIQGGNLENTVMGGFTGEF